MIFDKDKESPSLPMKETEGTSFVGNMLNRIADIFRLK